MTNPPEDRSSLAVALGWVSRVTTVAGMMIIPGLLGYWLDQRLGTRAVFTALGFGLGVSWGIWELVRIGGGGRGAGG